MTCCLACSNWSGVMPWACASASASSGVCGSSMRAEGAPRASCCHAECGGWCSDVPDAADAVRTARVRDGISKTCEASSSPRYDAGAPSLI